MRRAVHTDKASATAVTWSASNDCFSASDDRTIRSWSLSGDPSGVVFTLDDSAAFTDVQWFPATQRSQSSTTDVFVAATTDGKMRLMSKSGRVEKIVEAHRGALTAIRWNYEGTALVTAGEDGAVKIWSRAGMLRTQLAQNDRAVYSLAWGPDSDQVLYTYGRELCLKPTQSNSKKLQWKAHDGIVLCADWNPTNNLIVSGGEDCRYKIWDCYGRLLFAAKPFDYPVTSIRWCPDGEMFAVGSFNILRLCDRTGWSYSMEKPDTGSLFNIAWTPDGTQLAAAGGNGAVVFGYLIERRLEYQNLECVLVESRRIVVTDVTTGNTEELDFRDRVIKMSLAYDHLIVATTTQCCIYATHNFTTPHIFDLQDAVTLISQCAKFFAMLDNRTGIHIYTYEGRHVSNPKFQGLNTEFINSQSISLSNDALAVIDKVDKRIVRIFDVVTGKQLTTPITHSLEVLEISLDQHGPASERKVALIDRNRDLHVTTVHKQQVFKLGAMVDTCMWNDATGMLAAYMDGKFVVWYYPNVVYVDKDLLSATRSIKTGTEFGKNPQLVNFAGTHCTFRRMDGALVSATVSPYPAVLYEHCDKNEWDAAVRLCRYVKDSALWACLAAMAVSANKLDTAETALAAIDEVDKLQYILYIKDIPTQEGREAELLLFRRRYKEAEAVLLQASLIYRAIMMNVRLFKWDRALELAVNHKTHVDTVVAYRKRYLEQFGLEETSKRFLQYSKEIKVDWEAIKAKIAQEKQKEVERAGAKPYTEAQ